MVVVIFSVVFGRVLQENIWFWSTWPESWGDRPGPSKHKQFCSREFYKYISHKHRKHFHQTRLKLFRLPLFLQNSLMITGIYFYLNTDGDCIIDWNKMPIRILKHASTGCILLSYRRYWPTDFSAINIKVSAPRC